MKIAIPVVILFAVLWLIARSRAQTANSGTKVEKGKASLQAPKDVYLDLRNQMLRGSRKDFGLPASSGPNDPWGVLMDWGVGVEKGTVTVVAACDGSASVYFSSGGGHIGGKGQEGIRAAAKKAIEAARSVQLSVRAAPPYALPKRGGVTFYILNGCGRFRVEHYGAGVEFTQPSPEKDGGRDARHNYPISALVRKATEGGIEVMGRMPSGNNARLRV